VLTEDYTPDLADGFDDGREEIAPGVRLFLLEAAPETEQGLRAIALADHPNGEVVSGWLPSQPQSRGRMIVQVCELGDVTRAALERVWARPTFEVNGLLSGFTGDGAKAPTGLAGGTQPDAAGRLGEKLRRHPEDNRGKFSDQRV